MRFKKRIRGVMVSIRVRISYHLGKEEDEEDSGERSRSVLDRVCRSREFEGTKTRAMRLKAFRTLPLKAFISDRASSSPVIAGVKLV